ncbi:MAG TPA: BlaI/MecI/CopY family transcriptional regulator [Pseudonocardiaceae bacterium]|jgi:predicted transcriptional regulator|nr:BlaI/MecI/CopY family transcriptional regulator [Pseudonocardiaceae bacterium]
MAYGRGTLEAAVLAVLTAEPVALTVSEVQARLGGERAYTTVMTTLSRLHQKGALVRERHGRAFVYRAAAEPSGVADAMTARRMRSLLESGSDRAGVLARFVADLDPGDEQLLARIISQAEQPDPS